MDDVRGDDMSETRKDLLETIAKLEAERDDWKERASIMHRRAQQAEAPAMSIRDHKDMLWRLYSKLNAEPKQIERALAMFEACDGLDFETFRETRRTIKDWNKVLDKHLKNRWSQILDLQKKVVALEKRAETAERERDAAVKAVDNGENV